jgi:hypothetical protein
MREFSGNDVLELGDGVTVRAVGVAGRVREPGVRAAGPPEPGESLVAGGAPDDAAGVLGDAMAGSGMWVRNVVEFPELRGVAAAGHLEVDVEAPGPDEAQVVLEIDGDGLFRWHWPSEAPSIRASVSVQRFAIPVRQPVEAVREEVRLRSVIGRVIRKALHVIRFPIERAAETAALGLATWWENKHRPHRLYTLNPDGTKARDVGREWFAQPDLGPCLMLVHGTFSTGDASFAGLCNHSDFRVLHNRYQGRVLVFDHPTMHLSPQENARWLAKRQPGSLDIVAHSRGGLVAREIGRVLPAGTVNRMVQVASPNAGTALCSPQRLGMLLDVTTNLAGFLPESPVSAVLETTLAVVKHVAFGGFRGLPGLTAMDPDGAILANLNKAAAPTFPTHAIVSDYEPAEKASLAAKALDVTVDALFGSANDLVVPTASMSRAGTFAVKRPFQAKPGTGERPVAHSSYFGTSCVRAEIARCLALPAGALE